MRNPQAVLIASPSVKCCGITNRISYSMIMHKKLKMIGCFEIEYSRNYSQTFFSICIKQFWGISH